MLFYKITNCVVCAVERSIIAVIEPFYNPHILCFYELFQGYHGFSSIFLLYVKMELYSLKEFYVYRKLLNSFIALTEHVRASSYFPF